MTNPAEHRTSPSKRAAGSMTTGEILVRAVQEHRIVDLVYNGFRRSVEPYMVGIHQAGEAILLGHQIAGFSQRGEVPGWRTFILAEITEVVPTDQVFTSVRRDFNRDDSRMVEIFARA